jgi:hypothetical protein
MDGDKSEALRAVVDRPAFRDPTVKLPPDRYGDPLTRPDGTQVPCFDGQPTREQARQGRLGDCGLIATLGAVGAHRPGDISRSVQPNPDGTYRVVLNEARQTEHGAAPTGRTVELTITPDLPVYEADPDLPAFGTATSGTAWCPVLEKAFAGVAETWTPQRRVAWLDAWVAICADKPDGQVSMHSGPAPDGYVRLNQGTEPWERAEILTQLTGQEAVVREFPSGRDEWLINRIIRSQLQEGKPVLASSRQLNDGELKLPLNLEPKHVYEVTGVEKGKIILRNPWNYKHPEPMETDEFASNMRAWYTTLK